MKKPLLIIALFVATIAQAQQLQEVVYLKNGSIIRGIIIEQVPNESLKIKTADGSVFAYPMSDVEKITKEEYEKPQKQTRYKATKERYPVQVGIRAGMNASDMKNSVGEVGWSGNKSLIGYNVGVIVDVPIYENYFYVQPGLYLTQKGFKDKDDYWVYSANPTYLEIPILLSGRYKFDVVQLQLNFGPYLACGLFGSYKVKHDGEYSASGKSSFFGKDGEDMRRFDVGLSLGFGALFLDHYFIGFQYEWGLYNLYDSSYSSLKNRNFMLSIGYNF